MPGTVLGSGGTIVNKYGGGYRSTFKDKFLLEDIAKNEWNSYQ